MMTKNILLISLLIFFMSFLACQNQHSGKKLDSTENLRFTINIRDVISQSAEDYELEDVFSEYHYIKLENHPDGLLKHINNIVLHKENIFISDRYSVFQYDVHGKFIRRVGAPGNGPGEYYQSRIIFTLDTISQELIIKDKFKIIFYDLISGNFKREFGFDKHVEIFFPFVDDNLIFLTQEMSLEVASSINEVYLLNREGKIIDSIPNIERIKIRNNLVCFPFVYFSDNNFKYIYGYNDTIYQTNNDFTRDVYALMHLQNSVNYRDLLVASDDVELNHFSDLLRIANIIEYENKLFIAINKGLMFDNFLYIVYNIESNQISLVEKFLINNSNIQFWPSWFSNNTLIDYIFPYQILDNPVALKKQDITLQKIMKDMKEDDNPILVFVK